jgi:hypothetical protein
MTKFLNNADVTGYISQTSVTSSLLKTDSAGKLVAAVAGTDYNAPDVTSVAGTLIREIRNTTGATLTKGTVVYISGATGNKPTVSKALATGDSTSAQTFGLCQTDIANNSNGNVVCVGDITGLDTSAFTEGAQLYLSSTTAGTYTSTKQLAPAHLVYVGVVTRSHPTQGQIEVKIQNGYELDEIHDVAISSKANNDGLFYESATSLWKNKTIAAVLGYTPVDASLTANYVPKATGATTLANSNIQDSGSLITLGSDSYINGSVGIGTTSLTRYNLRVNKNITGSTTAYGIAVDGTIQSDVTSAAILFRTAPSTAASAFTLASLQHYTAGTTTIGAGSTVTNQFGFLVLATAIGATNNYAFAGQLANAANTWNLYMSGTANNYMAGRILQGSTVDTAASIKASGSITGATIAYGIRQDGTVQSDVTNNGYGFQNTLRTQTATFSLSNYIHYHASAATLGVGSTITNQTGFEVDSSLNSATNNYGFRGRIASGTNRWNLYMDGTADNYIAGNVGIGNSPNFVSAGPILTTTLTNGGSGYVDGTYTDVASSQVSSNGSYSLFTIVVSGGIVTTATLTWGGTTYRAGDTLTVSNTLLGGTGSGLVITVDTVDSSQLTVAGANGGDITLYRNDTSLSSGENIGTIKWESRDSSAKASGIYAEIGAFAAGTSGGAVLSFFTRSITAGTPLVEAMRIDSRGGVGIGATVIVGYNLKVSKNITGAATSFGVFSDGQIQSDVTSGNYFRTNASTQAASFTTSFLNHYVSTQGTFGAGSSVTNQYGFHAAATLIGATNNFGFYGDIPSGTNRWNLYMSGTANNYMAGSLGIGATNLTGVNLFISKTITGNIDSYSVNNNGTVQSDVTNSATYYRSGVSTAAATFTLATLQHYIANQGAFGAGSTVTNQYGFVAANTLIGATNNYGFYGAIASGTGRWNLYMVGTAWNYMAGNLGLGSTNPSNVNLRLSLNIAGGTNSYAMYAEGVVQSTVTSGASYYTSYASTQAASFTLTNLYHYAASQGTFGAGSTVTNQFGVYVGALIGATNNYGFYGGINSGTNRWNIYMAGTASNYLAGELGIGTTSINASAKVQIDSTTQGFLPPRMTAAQRTAIASPAEGLIVVQTDGTQGMYIYINATWRTLAMV